jgi:hypothetical protein
MTDTTYNGWRNHATWAIGLHLMDTVTAWIMDDAENWAAADVEQAAGLFQDLVEEQLDASGLMTYPLLNDLLDTSDIDWHSLGCHALEGCRLARPDAGLMRHPLTTILAVVSVTSALWFLTLAQLSGPSTYTSIPDHSTRTIWPGP